MMTLNEQNNINIKDTYEKDIESLIERITDLEVINEQLCHNYMLLKEENKRFKSLLNDIG